MLGPKRCWPRNAHIVEYADPGFNGDGRESTVAERLCDRTRDGVGDVVVTARPVVDAVASTARRSPFQAAQLGGEARMVDGPALILIDAGKLIKGKKRHILVDMQGLLLHAIIHSAGVQDRDGGIWLLATLFGQFPFLAKLFADSAYAGSIFHTALGKVLPNLKTEIVRRSDRAKGFVPLPKRWIVERTIAWLNRCRRLAKDWENLNRSALAFLKLASIRLMLRKLCNP